MVRIHFPNYHFLKKSTIFICNTVFHFQIKKNISCIWLTEKYRVILTDCKKDSVAMTLKDRSRIYLWSSVIALGRISLPIVELFK